MLDAQTKQRINSARNSLVGKVPDPKAQVEQITFALIYKFMHDMDLEAEELGGERKFFCGEFEQYSWSNLLAPTLGGDEVIKLYGDGIEAMESNRDIPVLFRDVFKNAYLPYRDPQTLKSFLKIINEFEYDHSERLGDAFEYLLSILGSQGDAGQFRTPRHIIDFVVEVVDPQKSETIMDPACGTAGFLISAYKHILKSNSKDGKDGAILTPDERIALTDNVTGYDISPDMVRLSLVNLYLHGFTNPNISEYDTLTSDDKWNEYFDVILANPPFMSPKGGIRPHNRFSIQAKRSEVLFVDYIAEHLNPNGRAGVIVPEGIIFQSQSAYKQLREMLVKDYLYAVISLPAGVFQPYSGVKTSILILDKEKAKQNDSILFVKVDNDGFDLGAQRRKIDKNDLPQALQILQTGEAENTDIAHWVEKSKIAETGDWNLSGERYLSSNENQVSNYEMVKLGKVVEILNGYAFKSNKYTSSGIRVIRITNVQKGKVVDNNPKFYPIEEKDEIQKYILQKNDLLLSLTGNVGRVGVIPEKMLPAGLNQRVACIRVNNEINSTYLFHILNQDYFENSCIVSSKGIAQKNLSTVWLAEFEIPLPPLSIQAEIVKEIESYQKIIDGARQVVDNYKPTIKINPDWEIVELGEITSLVSSGSTPLGGKKNYQSEGVMFIRSQNILKGKYDFSDVAHITDEVHQSMGRSMIMKNDVLLNITGASIGRCASYDLDDDANVNQHVAIIRVLKEMMLPQYLVTIINSPIIQNHIFKVQSGGSREALNYTQIKEFEIPFPSLSIQQEIVTQIEAEQEMVNANKKLIEIFKQKIKDKISEVWGEDG